MKLLIHTLPEGKKLIGYIWVFTRKRNSSGVIERYKARLCANGATQKFGVHYFDTFSPVLRHTCLRVFFSLCVQQDMIIVHADVKTAFLNGELSEEIYMRAPPEFDLAPGSVLRLTKSVYGLKQSSKN
jgi:hypothetical protein